MSTVELLVDGLFALVFAAIALAMAIVWIWNPLAASGLLGPWLSLPVVDVGPSLPALLIAGILLYLLRTVCDTYRP